MPFENVQAPSKSHHAEARAHLAAIVDSSDDPIVSKTLDGIITSWNSAASRVFGYEPDEIIGRSILTLIPPELHHEEEEILRKLRAGQRIEHFETIRVRKNGEQFPISVTISPIRDESGTVVGASKIARDITERKKLEESRFRLAAIVDSADDAIISKDLNGIVKTWNNGAERMFEYAAQDMIGQSILRLIPEHLQYEEESILKRLRAGGRIDHYETIRRKKNGELIEVSVTISPIQDESGTVIGASKIARDISDRKRMERRLLQSEKLAATGRMAAAVAHEINNPLEGVLNLVFLARQNSPAESKLHNLLLAAEGELERVAHIARQTLGYYKESGGPASVYVHDLLENVLLVYNSKIIANGISVETQFNDLRQITVMKGEFLQIFSNVIANAIDAMPEGGTLAISTRQVLSSANDGIQITIRDDGAGIDPQHLPHVFEAFFTTKASLGTGIGLWVAKQLVERRGGQITLTSTTDHKNPGTTLTIFVPFEQPNTVEEART